MEKLEADIRQQLLALQTSLLTLAKDKSTDDDRLSEGYGLLGQTYQAYSMTKPAQECYWNAHHLAAKDFRWAYLLGNSYQQEGRVEEALTYYKPRKLFLFHHTHAKAGFMNQRSSHTSGRAGTNHQYINLRFHTPELKSTTL